MLPRHSAVIISLTSLFVGILLGVVLGRGGPAVSAQVAPSAHAEVAADGGGADRSRLGHEQ